jgi:transcriptional regulator with XRE-family HTH domain
VFKAIATLLLYNKNMQNIGQRLKKLRIEKGLSIMDLGKAIGVNDMSSALAFAEDCEYIDRSPYKRIKLPKVEETEVGAFSNEEQTLIERVALHSSDPREFSF